MPIRKIDLILATPRDSLSPIGSILKVIPRLCEPQLFQLITKTSKSAAAVDGTSQSLGFFASW
ncbi:MAG: hypothetical protein LKH74_10560 [Levilactobacillus sp.]|nr:hypothetical protein [Levilactobacillus sp.]MCI1554350.1 hypothetical protein [Levilactobacillus sp.]MCI1599257.1 hypothetical protein [Levilactobacillus sp.]MCI1605745.1 hypothetical protein [Levilactobacillus sp.]